MEKVGNAYCGVWIVQVKEIACKLHHADCAGNGNGMYKCKVLWNVHVKKVQVNL